MPQMFLLKWLCIVFYFFIDTFGCNEMRLALFSIMIMTSSGLKELMYNIMSSWACTYCIVGLYMMNCVNDNVSFYFSVKQGINHVEWV